jgi:hypothetical protein
MFPVRNWSRKAMTPTSLVGINKVLFSAETQEKHHRRPSEEIRNPQSAIRN